MEWLVKVHRKLWNNPIFTNLELLGFFLYILLLVTHKKTSFFFWLEKVSLEAWQCLIWQRKIAKELGVHRNKISRMIKILSDEWILGHETTTKYTVITFIKRDEYQTSGTPKGHEEDTKRTPSSTYKNVKNIKNDKNINIWAFDFFWSSYPKRKWKPKAQQAYEKIIKSGKATHEQIMQWLDQYKREIALHQTPEQFIKRPQWWLNEARREDEIWQLLPALDDFEGWFPILDKEASTPTWRPKIDWIQQRSWFTREQASAIYQKRKFYLKQKAIWAER